MFRFSFLTVLDIYRDYFKGCLSWWNLMQRCYSCILWPKTICPSSSFSWRSCYVRFIAFVTCYACHIYLRCLLCTLFPLATHLFLSIACLLVSCLSICMYTHGATMHGARAQCPRHRQKGWGCKHVDMSQAVAVNRFRSLAFPFGCVLF